MAAMRPALVTVFLLAASVGPTSSAEGPSPSPGEIAEHTEDWGPLAVVSESGAGDAGIGPGTLSIRPECVTFLRDGAEADEEGVTLVWPSDATTWRPRGRRIVFEHPIQGTTRLTDRDRVMLGGQALGEDSPDVADEVAAWLEDAWVQPPDPSCPTAMWLVDEVRVPSSEGFHAVPGAKARGWTLEEAKLQQKASRTIRRVNGAIHDERPDIWIGGALSEQPGGVPSLYIKGPAPQFVRDLVAHADYLIAIVDDQPYSFDELEERSIRAHQALVDAGYPNVATGTNITGGGIIPVSLLAVAGLPTDPAQILELVPEDLRADVDLHVTVAPPRPSLPREAWGPLAVLYQPGGFGAGVGLGPVTLRIGDECVWIESRRSVHRTTLVWEANHVEWRPGTQRIVFTDRNGRTVRLADGDRIEGGGTTLWSRTLPDGQDPATSTPEPGRRWSASLDDAWLREPAPSCPEALFYLDEVTSK